jgi:hypothetical protein
MAIRFHPVFTALGLGLALLLDRNFAELRELGIILFGN